VTRIPIFTADDGTGKLSVGARWLRIKGRSKPIVLNQVISLPGRFAGKEGEVLIGRSGAVVAYRVIGEKDAKWMRTMEVRARSGKKEEKTLDLAASFAHELSGSRLDQVNDYAKSLNGYVVLGRMPVESNKAKVSIPLDRSQRITLPDEVGMAVVDLRKLWSEVVMSRPGMFRRARPVAVRLGTYSSDDALDYETATFRPIIELPVDKNLNARWPNHVQTPGGFRSVMNNLARWTSYFVSRSPRIRKAVQAAAASG